MTTTEAVDRHRELKARLLKDTHVALAMLVIGSGVMTGAWLGKIFLFYGLDPLWVFMPLVLSCVVVLVHFTALAAYVALVLLRDRRSAR